jgi:hypothetical protein
MTQIIIDGTMLLLMWLSMSYAMWAVYFLVGYFLIIQGITALVWNRIPFENRFASVKRRYKTQTEMWICLVLRALAPIMILFYEQYFLAGALTFIQIMYWTIYQSTIKTGKRMGYR